MTYIRERLDHCAKNPETAGLGYISGTCKSARTALDALTEMVPCDSYCARTDMTRRSYPCPHCNAQIGQEHAAKCCTCGTKARVAAILGVV